MDGESEHLNVFGFSELVAHAVTFGGQSEAGATVAENRVRSIAVCLAVARLRVRAPYGVGGSNVVAGPGMGVQLPAETNTRQNGSVG